MIGYILEGTGPLGAAVDKRMQRLVAAGPWQYQMHPQGCLATWRNITDGKGTAPTSMTAFGTPRPTKDGMTYLPPKVLPTPAQLLRPQYATRADLTQVVVSRDTGATIGILPAYLTPRQILEDNSPGDFTTRYGRAVQTLADKVYGEGDKKPKLTDCFDELIECARLAVMHTHRCTMELLVDEGWVSEETLLDIWDAAVHVPKALPPATVNG